MITYAQFNGLNSFDDLDLGILTSNEHPIPEDDVEFLEVKNRQAGSVVRQTKLYKDLIVKRTFRILKTDDIGIRVRRVREWLSSKVDNTLFFSNYPERCYIVKRAFIVKVKDVKELITEIDVEFRCEPFLGDSNEVAIDLPKNATNINNSGDIEAKPLMIFKLAGAAQNITITGGGKTLTVNGATGTLIVDCENLRAISDGIEKKTIGDFPVLPVGINTITWTGNGTATIKINKRYRG